MIHPKPQVLRGLMAAPGKASGQAVLLVGEPTGSPVAVAGNSDPAAEIERFRNAVRKAITEMKALKSQVFDRLGAEKAAIFEAQQLMVDDPALSASVIYLIEHEGVSAQDACAIVCEKQARELLELNDSYLSARAADMQDVGRRLIRCLGESASGTQAGTIQSLPDRTVLVASDLAPSDTVTIDTSKVVAIVLDHGGVTSHTAILLRSLGIPAVVATGSATSLIPEGSTVLVDADEAIVVANPDRATALEFAESVARTRKKSEHLKDLRDLPCITPDGRRIKLECNIGDPSEVDIVLRAGSDGVGLFRTEFLFLDRQSTPNEEEQYMAYSKVLSGLAPKPVTIRTLDIGGDKSIPYLNLAHEENSFLGLRGIRLCLRIPDLFRTQLRALLRASVHGNLQIMFPMICNVLELRQARAMLESTRRELISEGIPVSDHIKVGIMVEVPSAAIEADILAQECDFFSIGTNDLVQYTLAADRGNPSVADLFTPFHPSVLRLIARTIDEGHRYGIWVGMCGEMAGNPIAAPLLLGMGINRLSMAPGSVARIKHVIRNTALTQARQIWEHVSTLSTPTAITDYLLKIKHETRP